ncbi:terminase large subunit [Lactobacillus sp. ESL0791]|uniref:terminase TerL endonuclease subunit n=1 Tax=Lactobacillus sp. ESL0791 TaxID=2983234 RepID=UPI0023F922D3|nr:terminase TerL endonuclease subunit [Lactobacillus sp. ESL0791]MDF7639951.1 terminase large subunit [Lactobacillus sp. ESL0791]
MSSKVKEFDFTKRNVKLLPTFKSLLDVGYFNEVVEKYKDPATRYSIKVLTGKQLACYKIQLACFRHLNDLVRANNSDFEYYYDLEKCHEILNFAKLCPDVSMNKPTPLMLFQKAQLCLIQGWRAKKDKQKRFTYVLLSEARTNGKTYISNILLAYNFLIENLNSYNQDNLYSAPVEKQSNKGWRYIKQTFRLLGETLGFKKLIKQMQIDANDDVVKSKKSLSNLQRLTANSGQFDAYHFLLAVVDEYGDSHWNNGSMGRITSGQVQTKNHQVIAVSTAYGNSNCPMFEDEKRLLQVLEKDNNRDEDSSLMLVWEQDNIDETDEPELWVKSNPLLDLPSLHDTLLKGLKDEYERRSKSGEVYKFQNRNLNLWLATSVNKYLQLDDIQSAVIKNDEFDITGRDCYAGFDLSRFSDDTAIAFVFPFMEDGQKRFFIYQHSFVPTARAQKSITIKSEQDGINYQGAEDKGFCDVAKNQYGEIDEELVGNWLLEFIKKYKLNIKAFVYDTYGASTLTDWWEQQLPSIPFITLRQGTLSLDSPTNVLRKAFETKQIRMYEDPILQYSVSNAVITENAYGAKIDKEKRTAKIDCVDAIIDAMSEAVYWFTDPDRNQQDESKKNPFGDMSQDDINDYYKNYFGF